MDRLEKLLVLVRSGPAARVLGCVPCRSLMRGDPISSIFFPCFSVARMTGNDRPEHAHRATVGRRCCARLGVSELDPRRKRTGEPVRGLDRRRWPRPVASSEQDRTRTAGWGPPLIRFPPEAADTEREGRPAAAQPSSDEGTSKAGWAHRVR